MLGRTVSWSAVVRLGAVATVIALAANAVAAPAPAGGAATRGLIQWQSGSVETFPQDAATVVATALNAAARGDARVVLQFEAPLTAAQRAALPAAGVTLLGYIHDNAYFARVDAAEFTLERVSALGNVRCVLPIQLAWKMHPDLLAGRIPAYAYVAGGPPLTRDAKPDPEAKAGTLPAADAVAAAYVLFHADVPLATNAVSLVLAHGGRVVGLLHSVNAAVIELPVAQFEALAAQDAVQWIEPPLPQFTVNNNSNRARVGADTAQSPPYGLTGAGVSVLVYDAGTGQASHPDFQGRLFVRDTSGTHYHSSHVAGTVGGGGVVNPLYRGMAPQVTFQAYGFEMPGGLQQGFLYTYPGDIEADYNQAINTYGADIATNSIGTNTASNGYPCDWEGNYGITDTVIDAIVRGSLGAPFRVVWANGNERSSGRCGTTFRTTAPPACGKNHITVGALNSNDDSMTSFSSWGPADDNRLKPDISAPGCQSNDDNGVTSCNTSSGYTSLCGTSMACPTVAGIGALLIQDFRQQYPGEPDFRNSTLKILLAHTAVDLGNVGPDYKFGYGSVRAPAAVDLLRSGNFLENQVAQGETFEAIIIVNPGQSPLKATLAWDDPPGNPAVIPVLVNDLDLVVYDAANNAYYPWTLGGVANPDAPAVRTAPNRVDNIEQVVIDNPTPGAYRVQVRGYAVPQGPQPFSLAATPLLVNCSSQGTANLDRAKYPCNGSAVLRVVDCDLNTSDAVVDTVTVLVTSTSEPAGERIVLTETAPEAAAFQATLPISTTDAPGVLLVADGDTITMTYQDADDGSGAPATALDTAVVDCQGPVIGNVQMTDLQPRSATIAFSANENITATVRYGTACDDLNMSVAAMGVHQSHSVTLSGLIDNTPYYFVIDGVDEAGNAATADNGGTCFTFATPEVPDFFTELFSGAADMDYRTLLFTPNGSVDFYAACGYPVTEFPTDPTAGTTLSFVNSSGSATTDDGYATINLTGGARVSLYGTAYSTFYVGTNGYITFDTFDTAFSESYTAHFGKKRVAAVFDDLNIASGGTVKFQQFADRAVVTWLNVIEYGNSNSRNSFQIELYFDGRIQITWLRVDTNDYIAGLSNGAGLSPDFLPSDLSGYGTCGPRPPTARSGTVTTLRAQPIAITLGADDDGLPNPPATLSYVITQLPVGQAEVKDAGNGHVIAPADLPYTLAPGGTQVIYRPYSTFVGTHTLLFYADDGGTPPDGGPSATATITINVVAGQPAVAVSFPLDTNPGWTTEGQWAFGQPTGGGSHNLDPTSGYTGLNVYGYNLAGDYPNNMPIHSLTSTPIDCSTLSGCTLKFWRWLGIESATYDHASVQVSNNGTTWTTIWNHTGVAISENAWSRQSYGIAAVADHQPTVYLRWTMGPTDSSVTYPGWNIDDIEIWADQSPVLGDMNCDGVLDFDDIDPFVLALSGEAAYGAQYPDCVYWYADVNGDGAVDFDDIDAFVAALSGN